MTLCACGHLRSDHKLYFGTRGNGNSYCSVPECECEGFVREGTQTHPKSEDTVMRCIRITKKDIQASLNRKFGKEKLGDDGTSARRGGMSRDVSANRRVRK